MLMYLKTKELVYSQSFIYRIWKSISWWLSIVDGEDWNIYLFGPPPSIVLHGFTRKSNKTSSMSMKNHILKVMADVCQRPAATA